MKMICKIWMPCYNSTFINGSTNYKLSTLKDRVQTDCHKRTVRQNDEMHAKASGISLTMRKIVETIPKDSAMKKCVSK